MPQRIGCPPWRRRRSPKRSGDSNCLAYTACEYVECWIWNLGKPAKGWESWICQAPSLVNPVTFQFCWDPLHRGQGQMMAKPCQSHHSGVWSPWSGLQRLSRKLRSLRTLHLFIGKKIWLSFLLDMLEMKAQGSTFDIQAPHRRKSWRHSCWSCEKPCCQGNLLDLSTRVSLNPNVGQISLNFCPRIRRLAKDAVRAEKSGV